MLALDANLMCVRRVMAVAAFNCSTSIALYNAHDAAFRQRWKVKWSGERRRCFVSFAKNPCFKFLQTAIYQHVYLAFSIPAFHSVNAKLICF